MPRLRIFRQCWLLCAVFALLGQNLSAQENKNSFATALRAGKRPRLAVVISIDQFRADLLTRNADLFLPAQNGKQVGGFQYLMTQGSWFVNAQHAHFPTFTGPGHSVLLTGSTPSMNGIIANEWWDKLIGGVRYCVDDETAHIKVVGKVEGSRAKPMSAKSLLVTTVGDELKLASNGRAKTVSIALKDRAAILLAGHAADTCLWFDDYTGRWISSTAYAKNGELPKWAQKVNDENIPEKHFGKVWKPSVSAEVLKRAKPTKLDPDNEPYGLGSSFPHRIGTEKGRITFRAFTTTPFANGFVFATAEAAIIGEQMGSHEGISDLLTINLSSNDYIGHAFGPYSPEVLDATVQTDRQLSEFLNFIEANVPGGLRETLVIVTADHGVAPIAEQLNDINIDAGKVLEGTINLVTEEALRQAFGLRVWVGAEQGQNAKGGYVEPYITLNEENIQQTLRSGKAKSREEIEKVVADAVSKMDGIYACYTHTQLLSGNLPRIPLTQRLARGFHPQLSGDVMVVSTPHHYTDPGTKGPYATSHGTAYNYDTHVPILMVGFGIRAGVWAQPVTPLDIAPTLSLLLGIEFPSACEGNPLVPALH